MACRVLIITIQLVIITRKQPQNTVHKHVSVAAFQKNLIDKTVSGQIGPTKPFAGPALWLGLVHNPAAACVASFFSPS